MKRLSYLLLSVFIFVGCQDGSNPLNVPSNVSSITARPDTGAAVVSWDMPADSSYLYLNVSYDKYPNDPDTSEIITTKVSKYTDSVLVEGLLNKYEYTFTVQPFNDNGEQKVGGEKLESNSVSPIRRPVKKVYYPDSLTKIEGITGDMMDSYTHHEPAGPESNLIDGDINTIWHSDWSTGVEPLPHWIEYTFDQEVTVGAIKYFLRQTSDTRGFPTQFALATSEDSTNWKQQWTSEEDLPYNPITEEKTLAFDKNYTSKHLRIMFLENAGGTPWVHMAELYLYKMKVEEIDLEERAEANY